MMSFQNNDYGRYGRTMIQYSHSDNLPKNDMTSFPLRGYAPSTMISPLSAPGSVPPRSAAEESMDPDASKYRQLPCRTFVSVGTCPYRERCVYLHDPRCLCKSAKTKTRRKNKEDTILDSLFWPIMPQDTVMRRVDNTGSPHVIQPYHVPCPQDPRFLYHDEAVYSIWNHFVDTCLAITASANCSEPDDSIQFKAINCPINSYTKKERLSVFVELSNGISLDSSAADQSEFVKPLTHFEDECSDEGSLGDESIMSSSFRDSMDSFDASRSSTSSPAGIDSVHYFSPKSNRTSKNGGCEGKERRPDGRLEFIAMEMDLYQKKMEALAKESLAIKALRTIREFPGVGLSSVPSNKSFDRSDFGYYATENTFTQSVPERILHVNGGFMNYNQSRNCRFTEDFL